MNAHNVLPIALILAIAGAGSIALANHVAEVDPAGVPTGFLTTHTGFDRIGAARRDRLPATRTAAP